ncbi:MAG: GTPase HflX, partial [Atopobiaceae bacterium]|nr:GTPase HflX [Atopobiaceae bacterium]
DTVGFIQKLPTKLVEAFKSTLAEVVAADLILLVVDASDPNADKEIVTVEGVLADIGAADKRRVIVYNKIDLLDEAERRSLAIEHPDAVLISALEGNGIRGLLYRIAQEASDGDVTLTVLVPYEKGMLIKMVHERCQVVSERYEENGLLATVRASERMASTLDPYVVE